MRWNDLEWVDVNLSTSFLYALHPAGEAGAAKVAKSSALAVPSTEVLTSSFVA